MAEFVLDGIGIKGISCAVPNHRVDNVVFYEEFGKKVVDDVMDMTGVRFSFRTPERQTASDLCYVAAKNLIDAKGIVPEEIGALVFVSQTPDYRIPATACVLHERLGLTKNCMAFDVNLGCSGWVYGINIAGALMTTSGIDKALLLFGDTCTKTAPPGDRGIMLFGEAGSATLLVKDKESEIKGELMTDGDGYKAILMPVGGYRHREKILCSTQSGEDRVISDHEGYMNGTDVFSFTITQVPKMIKNYPGKVGTTLDQYDALILHQANLYVLKQISKKTKVPMEKIPVSIDRYGNTSGASIPITLCDAYGEDNDRDLHLLFCGYGVGLSWGCVDAYIQSNDILPIIQTEDFYEDGGVEL